MNENLKINIKDLLEGDVALDVDEDALGSEIFSGEDEIEFSKRITGRIKFTKAGKMIWAQGKLETAVKLVCVKCLEEFAYKVNAPFNIVYTQKPEFSEKEIELTKDDLDLAYFDEDFICPNNEIREAIILNIPLNPRCKADCLGLCLRCGINLNLTKCNCESRSDEEKTAEWKTKLKKFKLKLN